MKLYIIPAYGDTIRNQGYRRIITEAEKKGYEIIVLNLQIKNKLLSDLVDKAIKTIGKNTDCTVFGFSVGALIAFCVSKKIPITKGIFCSITPALGRDISKDLKLFQKYFGKETVEELKKMRYGKSLCKQPVFICGSNEGEKLVGRTKKIYKINGGKLIIVKNNEHELNKAYVDEIVKAI